MSQKHSANYCQELAELIATCDPDNPDPQLIQTIDRHVELCETCQAAESALDDTVRAYRELEPRGVSAEFEEALVNQLCRPGKSVDQA